MLTFHRISHIPSNLVVDRWTSDAESSSLLDSPFLPDVWSYTLSQNNLSNISKLKIPGRAGGYPPGPPTDPDVSN